jgi:hypothetical protein
MGVSNFYGTCHVIPATAANPVRLFWMPGQARHDNGAQLLKGNLARKSGHTLEDDDGFFVLTAGITAVQLVPIGQYSNPHEGSEYASNNRGVSNVFGTNPTA